MVFNKQFFESKKFIALALGVLTDVVLPLLQAHFQWLTPDMMHYILVGVNALAVAYIGTQGIIDGKTQLALIQADIQKLALAIAGVKSGAVKPEDIIAIAEAMVVDIGGVISNINTPDVPPSPPAPPAPAPVIPVSPSPLVNTARLVGIKRFPR